MRDNFVELFISHTTLLQKSYLAIAKKQKSADNVLLLAPTFVKKFAPELANRPRKIIFDNFL